MRFIVLFGAGLAIACGDSRTPGSAFEEYDNENVTVIGGDDASATGDDRITLSSPKGEGECVEISDNLCVPVDATGEWCEREGGPVDIVVVNGEVEEVICYPPDGNDGKPEVIVDTSQSGDLEILQNASRTAVTFDESTNGEPIATNLDIEGNNVAIYGNGPDNTIIDGDVVLSGNNIRLRGVTIDGDLIWSQNNSSVILCRVLGNVIMSTTNTNGSVSVENDVFGDFSADSNSNTFVGNDVQGTWTIIGNNNLCDANRAFTDDNSNQLVDDGERAPDTLACP